MYLIRNLEPGNFYFKQSSIVLGLIYYCPCNTGASLSNGAVSAVEKNAKATQNPYQLRDCNLFMNLM